MADSSLSSHRDIDALMKNSNKMKAGNPTRYRLKTTTDKLHQSESYRKITFGERDTNKPHKIILMVGETGTGKTTLINTMINYSCGVKREDKVWFEITDEINRSSVYSQTSDVTVYGVYIPESSVDLTIIDTPGYGDTRGADRDKEIARNLLHLCTSEDVMNQINAVCFVIKADQNRLSDRQQYIFDAVQSLFGKDIVDNIVLLFTHSDGAPPKNALTAVKAAKVKCAVDQKKNQPIYFLFNNRQEETFDEDYQFIYEQAWDLSYRGMTVFFKFLDMIRYKTLEMTQNVLKQRKQLEASISNLQSRVYIIELKQSVLKQTQDAVVKNKQDVRRHKNFEYEVQVWYKEKVDIDPTVAKKATCCRVCEENCHYPGCWWVDDLSWCSVMKNNHCTVCTNKCHNGKHIKEAKIYVTKTRFEKRTYEELKKKYEEQIGDDEALVRKLKEELQELEKDKIKLVMEASHCVKSLKMMALNTFSLFTLQHIDFLIEKLNEINEPENVSALEDIRKSEAEGKKAIDLIKNIFIK